MHKFTIFTIIFSAVVIITVGELVVHDYLDRHNEGVAVVDADENTAVEPDGVVVPEPENEEIVPEQEMPEFEPEPSVPGWDFTGFGFAEDIELKEKSFSGDVFSFLEYGSLFSEAFYWELFEGGEYAAGIYEIICENPTEAFTVYTDLRESGAGSDSGEVNEVNMYGEASFYFNDPTKTTTIFMVVLGEDRVWAFTYGHKYHSAFKELFNVL